ncbi:MAG: hypothetical protein GC161_07225 [Planctomycetaceae bacterium]|nr:hypothetical protein [Planctomycetaceae bacterium]
MPDTHPDTPRIHAPDAPPTPEVLEALLGALASGRPVALPSETAYILVARADHAPALARLAAEAARHLNPEAVHLAPALLLQGAEALGTARRPLSPLSQRLAARYWPGPLSLVLEGPDNRAPALVKDGTTRYACVAQRTTAALVAAAEFPLAAQESAGPGGALDVDAEGALRHHGEGLALVLDGGPSRLGEASAVLAVTRGRFELWREGLLPLEQLRKTAGLSIAFVCTGNTCRSPMAEALARAELRRRLGTESLSEFGFRLLSAGVQAAVGAPAANHAIDVLAARSIDLTGHRAQAAIPEEIARLDRVYCLTRGHREALVLALPPGRAAHVELLDPDGRDIPDPIGRPRSEYEHCADALAAAVERRAAEWA